MQIVIEISEELYESIKKLPDFMSGMLQDAIKNGTPLPKGHGRLIDADKLYTEYINEPEEFHGGHSFMALFRNADTIIETDK